VSRPDSTPATRRVRRIQAARIAAGLALLLLAAGAATAASEAVAVGRGSYYEGPQGGGRDTRVPAAQYRSGEAAAVAAPTNQWYSSVMFERWSQPIHAHPMTYRATEQGFEIGLPVRRVATVQGALEARYAHAAAITVSPVAFTPQDARLSKFSDWLARISMAAGPGQSLDATVLHGSPFSYYECSAGDVRFRFASAPVFVVDPTDSSRDGRMAAVSVAGGTYAIFAPAGATWERSAATDLVLHLPAAGRYFSVAGLPDARDATLRDFLSVAYAFPVETRVEWAYDERASVVRTTFKVQTNAREGGDVATFLGVYPHQWGSLVPAQPAAYTYDSVRGPIRLVKGTGFSIERRYGGFVPRWAGLEDKAAAESVDSLMVGDLAKADRLFMRQGRGTYWIGKGLGAVTQLMNVAAAQGQDGTRDELLSLLKSRLESWFDGKHSTYFFQDSTIGTFVGVPQEYDSITAMNDHHFHYGYWIMAAANVALRDPQWAAPDQWGGMVGKLVADIATDERGRKDFPFLRNFDPYEGHSWASGNAFFEDGNNQESSSEAVNAWAALVLWAEATGNRRLRDLGIYLYTTEVASIGQYWFDLDRQVLAADYGKPYASMVFGGKYSYNTWWTQEPRQILGINILPITPASTYLGADPRAVRTLVDALPGEVKAYHDRGMDDGTPNDIWQDVIASYLALADPDAALAMWNRRGSVENGETRTHTLHWLLSLKEMGGPDFSVHADTPLYAVFKDSAGRRTYLAYNAGATPLRVTFSDGKVVEVPARSLARVR
jgi:endoglucanase Acf2